MAQPIHFSIHIAPLPIVAMVLISQVLFKEKFMEMVGHRFNLIVDAVYAAGKNLVLESPVTVLTAAMTYAVHPLTAHTPSLALAPADPLKAALFVAGIFALKSALSPALEEATKTKGEVLHGTLVRNAVVRNFFPLFLGTACAFYAEIPVRLAQSALYTAALIPLVKLLGKGFDAFCEMSDVKALIHEWFFWIDKPQS